MIFKFEPIYQERVWGGDMFSRFLGRKSLPYDKIGESWDIVDRENLSSKVINLGKEKLPLRALIESNPENILGRNWKKDDKFPILVKWLDCSDRLSLQVHPPTSIAKSLNGEPKTENWYIANANPNAGLFAGLKNGTTKEDFAKSLKNGQAEKYCHRIESKRDSSILIESGRIHAIDSGNLILEIQQNSDTTYRVYDWDRDGLNGKPRELHLEQSMKSIDFEDYEPNLLNTTKDIGIETIAHCKEFRIRKCNLNPKDLIHLKDENIDCLLIHVVEGSIMVGDEQINLGEHGLCPYSDSCTVQSNEQSTFLVTDQFSQL